MLVRNYLLMTLLAILVAAAILGYYHFHGQQDELLRVVVLVLVSAYTAIAACSIWWSYNSVSRSLELRDKALEERSQMMANISHDLKTPITVIAGYSKAICDGLIPDEDKPMYFESIYQKSRHLSDLINTFAEYSKLEHPDFHLNLWKMDLAELLRQYLAELYGELEIEGFLLEARIPEQPVYCMLNEFAFVRILENIMENSIRYNEAGTCLFVKLSCDENTGEAVLSLGDNGRGIQEKLKGRIFEPFVVGEEARGNGQGSGLGLAVVKRLVTEHEGTIELNPHPAEGISTEFIIRLKQCF